MVLASRRERIYQRFPDPVSGYELDPERGYFSVIIPEATTNLVTNPSFEGGVTTGLGAYGAGVAVADIATWQAYGAYGLQITPASAVESGFFWGNVTLAVSTTYTASITIQGEEGKKYYIWFASTAGAQIGTKRLWIGTGHKQRIWVTHTETTGAARRVYVARDAQYTDTNLFYADGLQVEAKSYPTTYCDGDQVGFVINQAAYLWTGTRGASTSTRSAQTRAGGREVSLLSLGLRVLTVLGLGMAPLVDQALPMPGRGELAQGTGTTTREFTLVTALYADGPGPRHLQALRSGLIDAFKPDAVTVDQPLILRYQACDDEGDPLGESLDIVCKYMSGLEGNWDNHQQERLPIQFKMHLPLIQNTYDSGAELGYQTSIPVFNYVGFRDTDGVWTAMGTGADGLVYEITAGPDGAIYIGGTFNSVDGVANTSQIAQWSGGAWGALGTGLSVIVNALTFGADGSLYIGGGFQNAGGVAAADYIAKWDGANYTALGTGMDNQVLTIAIGPDGTLYAGGLFHLAGGVANTVHIAMWKGGVWYPMGTGMDDDVDDIVIGLDGTVYATGDFTTAGGVTVNGVAKWNGVTWGPLGSGVSGGGGRALTVGLDGALYCGGTFTSVIGVPNTAYLAKWNGQVWSSIGVVDNLVYSLDTGPDGKIYVGGAFLTVNGIQPPDSLMVWFNNTWLPMDINLSGLADYIYAIEFDALGRLYIGGPFTSAVSATVVVPNVGSSTAYPVIIFTGPGITYQLKNYTTGKAIYFNLTLLAGETAILDLNPTHISFQSSFRGNILDTILPGSNLDFPLMPGANNISAYMFGSTTVATAITMSWREQYWSLDGAAWK